MFNFFCFVLFVMDPRVLHSVSRGPVSSAMLKHERVNSWQDDRKCNIELLSGTGDYIPVF